MGAYGIRGASDKITPASLFSPATTALECGPTQRGNENRRLGDFWDRSILKHQPRRWRMRGPRRHSCFYFYCLRSPVWSLKATHSISGGFRPRGGEVGVLYTGAFSALLPPKHSRPGSPCPPPRGPRDFQEGAGVGKGKPMWGLGRGSCGPQDAKA